MKTNLTLQTTERYKLKGVIDRLGRSWHSLTGPAVTIQDPESRRRAQLLSAILVVLIPLSILVFGLRLLIDAAFSPSLIAVGGLIVLPSIYGLSRTKYEKLAAWFIASLFPIAIFATVIATYNPAEFRNLLFFLSRGVLLSSILLSVRATFILAAIDIGVMLLLPAFIAEETFTEIIQPLTFLILLTVLVLFALRQSNGIVMDQQVELSKGIPEKDPENDETTEPTQSEAAFTELLRISAALNAPNLSVDSVLEFITESSNLIVHSKFSALFSLDEETEKLVLIDSFKAPSAYSALIKKGFSISMGEGPAGIAFQEQEPILMEDLLHNTVFSKWKKIAKREKYNAIYSFPIMVAAKPKFVLNFYFAEPHPRISKSQFTMLETL